MDRQDRPTRREIAPKKTLHCCCGRPECLILKKNCSVLESVEKDVHTAAQLGQALLSRHEAYMAEAERDRMRLNTRIERLELDKGELETQNALKVQDNLALIEQLESLNTTVSDADARIKALEATLLSSQQALRHLEGSATRADDAERHLQEVIEQQEKLHDELQSSREEARSHAYRFKEAQRGILDMQDQLDRMEKEARQERERHVEIVEKMERQREVEKQLDAAALRLKGAAASKTMKYQRGGGSNQIVGNFVRDLLQDNANLQLAIAELREMLLNSNDEIQSLRDQLLFHQPVLQNEGAGLSSSLKTELHPLLDSPRLSQQMHVHHHYHVSGRDGRRPKRKRQGLLPGVFPSPTQRSSSTPASTERWRSVSSPTGFSSRPGDDITSTPPMPISGSWNEYSTPSSVDPSLVGSPQSSFRGYFDNAAPDMDYSVSPSTSYDPISPMWRVPHKKRMLETSSSSLQPLPVADDESAAPNASQLQPRWANATILEEEEEQHAASCVSPRQRVSPSMMTLAEELDHLGHTGREASLGPRPRQPEVSPHHHITSFASFLDNHTTTSRPTPTTCRLLGGADAVVTDVNAEPTLSRTYSRASDASLRNHFAHFQVSKSPSPLTSEAIASQTPRRGPVNLGNWTGWRLWGGSSSANLASARHKEEDEFKRTPGINQPGIVPGFPSYWAFQKRKGAPAQVTIKTIDRDALSESLCQVVSE